MVSRIGNALLVVLLGLGALVSGCQTDADLPEVPQPSPVSPYSNYRESVYGIYGVLQTQSLSQGVPPVWTQTSYLDTLRVSPNMGDTSAIDIHFQSDGLTLTFPISPQYAYSHTFSQETFGVQTTNLQFQVEETAVGFNYSYRYWDQDGVLRITRMVTGERMQ